MSLLLNPELESRIAAKVQSGRYSSANEVVEQGLVLLDAKEHAEGSPDGAAISEMIVAIGRSTPAEEWERVPTDLSFNLDHYLYGTPRRDR